MLLGNITRLVQNPIQFSAYHGCNERSMLGITTSNALLRFSSMDSKAAIPYGYLPEHSWFMALKSGGIGCTGGIISVGDILAANLAAGIGIEATLAGIGEINNAAMGLIVSAVATLTGSGLFNSDVVGKLDATATLAGTGDITGTLGALAGLLSDITSKGEISNTTINAKAFMSADITPFTELSPQALAASVWNTLAADFNTLGTMGQKLNSAAVGGVDYEALANAVWEAISAEHIDPASLGGLMAALQLKVDELHKLQGLDGDNPMTVSNTRRIAGDIELAITEQGSNTTKVIRV